MNLQFPDYDRSILSLPNSVLKHFGEAPFHATLPELDKVLTEGRKKVVLMLFDGLGMSLLEKHLPADSFLRTHMLTPVTSVFPPTTVAAETAVETGKSPLETGHLGWDLWFDEMGENYAIFGRKGETSGLPYPDGDVEELFLPKEPIYKLLAGKGIKSVGLAPFWPPYFKTLRVFFKLAGEALSEDVPTFVYAYWMNPDHDAHEYGTDSAKIGKILRQIDKGVENFARTLQDATLIITADHSLINVDMVNLLDFPELVAMFRHEPSIEPRACALFIKDECKTAFPAAFNAHFGSLFQLYTKEDALRMGLFGPGEAHPRSPRFMGDFIACAKDSASFAFGPVDHPQKALHAGLTEEEMMVPVIVVRT